MRLYTKPLAAILYAVSTFALASASAHASELKSFSIPAEALPDALTQYAQQAGVQIFFPSAQIADRRSTTLQGAYDSREALRKLIAGSNLEVASDDGKIIILRAKGTGAQANGDSAVPSDAASPVEVVIVNASPRAGTLKRKSDTVVNTVTQLEVGRLPNMDVSDALARLPGVRRNDTQSGEDRYVQIRGLVNSAASQSIDGVLLTDYINGSRATSTEVLSANFTKNMTVTTTVTPDLDESSNAGHIALTTISGLDTQGTPLTNLHFMVGDASRADGDIKTRTPVRFSGTWQGALDSAGKYGLALGAGFDQLGSRQDAVSIASVSKINGFNVPNGALTNGQTYSKTQRTSAMARFDARPNDQLSLFAEYFFMEHEFQTDQETATVNVTATTVAAATADTGQFNSGGATYGFNQGRPTVHDQIAQFGADYQINSEDTLSSRVGITSDRVTSFGVSTSGFTESSGAFSSPVGYVLDHNDLTLNPGSSAATSNPANYLLTGKVTVSDIVSNDLNFFARVDYSHNMALSAKGFGYKAGAQLKTLERQNTQYGYGRILAPGQSIALSEVTSAASVSQLDPVRWNQNKFLDLMNQRGIASPDANRLYAADPADSYGQNFSGSERVEDLYGIVSYGFDRARISGGVRVAQTHRTLDQFEPNTVGVWAPAHYEQNYTHVLPSLYGYYDLTSKLKFRAAFTQTLERPAINSSSRRLVTSYDVPVTRTISYSNPYLMPIRSTNLDSDVEWYYGKNDAYLSLGVFSKYLRDISAVSSTQDIGADGVREITSYTSNVAEVNGKKVYGKDQGVEMVWSDPKLPYFPEGWGNLGANIAYDYIVYQVTALNGGGGVPPTDVRLVDNGPRQYFNASLFYKKGPFAANLYTQYISEVPSMSYNPANDKHTLYAPLVDAQVSYAVNRSLRLVFEGRNLMDQNIVDRYGTSNYGPAYQIRHNGRTLWVGAQVSLF